ncbi:MAG TPA: D-Ala-D-Ala carboxypeptidase family metallohydrolase [Candidatus Obscuribacterales bacterium]
MKVKVKHDTLFKLQPVLSSELTDAEKRVVARGTEYEVKFFTDVDNHHLRLELADPSPTAPQSTTWYVHRADLDIIGSGVTVIARKDTLFKLQPVLSSDLSDRDKRLVTADQAFELQSYTPAPGGHIKLTLVDTPWDAAQGQVWYANAADIQLSGQKLTLQVMSDTLFKAKPSLSSQLASTDKVFVAKHSTFALQSYSEVEGNYLQITLAGAALGGSDRLTWYAFAPDIALEGTEAGDRPVDTNLAGTAQTDTPGAPLQLPGFQGVFYANAPIIAGGHFTWGQATHGGTRLPASAAVVYGIIRIAEAMEEVRTLLGDRPITVTSWYRDPATNLRVGGTSHSRHIHGDAVNFVVADYAPNDVYAQLDPWWGARGGLATATQFTHIDARGYRARWLYDV